MIVRPLIGNAVLAVTLILAAGAGQGVGVEPVASDHAVGFDRPVDRAQALGLPTPIEVYDPRGGLRARDHGACAVEINDAEPVACFPTGTDVQDYIAGHDRRSGITSLQLTGTGGIEASTTQSGTNIAITCKVTPTVCTNALYWFINSTNIHCTHTYSANDFYRNAVPAFTTFWNNMYGTSANCNRAVLYPGQLQQGGGAINCYLGYCDYNPTLYQSWSMHYL
jgi:hypothetical protein